MPVDQISLVIFTCEGREHLIQATLSAFRQRCNHCFYRTILAIDGRIDLKVIDIVQPDLLVQSYSRKGYINNILQALSLINTDYFFWLEDDWHFPVDIPVEEFIRLLELPEILQVVLSKTDYNQTFTKYNGNYYIPKDGFSANPGICRTKEIKEGFERIRRTKKDESTQLIGFENALNDYAVLKQMITLKYIIDYRSTVEHSGELESTPREYHMINSLDNRHTFIDKEYISGFGYEKKIGLANKAGMTLKLWLATIALSVRLWSFRDAYDFAFRIYLGFRKKFKN